MIWMKNRKVIIRWLIGIIVTALLITILILFRGRDINENYRIIYIPKTIDSTNDFWTCVVAGAQMAAKENHVELEIMPPENEQDIEGQNQLILDAVEKHPNAIVVSPTSQTESLEELSSVLEAGIKLVFIDSKASEALEDVSVSTDNYAAGAKMAEPILKSITKDSTIAIVAHMKNSSTAIEREQGLRDALGEYADQIVDVVYSNSNYDVAYQVTEEMLKKEHIDYLACLNEYSAVGAAKAVKDMDLQDDMCVIGFDNSTKEIQMLEEGIFDAIVVQKAFSMGYLGIEAAVKDIRGEAQEHYIDSGSVLITSDNMYDVENQELLFPFYKK